MKKIIKSLFIFLFFSALLFPVVLNIFSFDLTEQAKGVEKKEKNISFNLSNILSGEYQSKYNKKFKRKTKIWQFFLRTDNEINYQLFNQISSQYDSKIINGQNNHLIEKAYLASLSKIRVPKDKRIKLRVDQLREFQKILKSRGKEFLLIISSNKPSLYPEVVPPGFIYQGREDVKNGYEKIIPLLKKEKINFFDAHQFLKDVKKENNYSLFATSGTHWNRYATCLVTSELLIKVQSLLERKIKLIDCGEVNVISGPIYEDRDLLRIANIWSKESFIFPEPSPKIKVLDSKLAYQPNILFEGTSFLWSVLNILDKAEIYRERDMFYYFKSNYSFSKKSKKPIDKDNFDLNSYIDNKDIVILEINEAFVHKVGHGLLKFTIDNY